MNVGKRYLDKLFDVVIKNLDTETDVLVDEIESSDEFIEVINLLEKIHGENGKKAIGKTDKVIDYIKKRLMND